MPSYNFAIIYFFSQYEITMKKIKTQIKAKENSIKNLKKKVEIGYSEENERSDSNAFQEGIDALKNDISQLQSDLKAAKANLALAKQTQHSWNGINQRDLRYVPPVFVDSAFVLKRQYRRLR